MTTTIIMIGTMIAALIFFRVGIPFLQKRFRRPVWEYKPTTPIEVLQRHHRFAVCMIYAQFFVVAGLVSSIAQWVILGMGTSGIYPVAFFGCLLLPVAIFGIFGPVWFEEITNALKSRKLPIPAHNDIAAVVKSKTKTMMFWIGLALLSPWLLSGIKTILKTSGVIGSCGLLLAGCSDVVKTEYATLDEAKSKGAFERGWLPPVLPEGSTHIVEKNDLDANTGSGSFDFQTGSIAPFLETMRTGFSATVTDNSLGTDIDVAKDGTKWNIHIDQKTRKGTYIVQSINKTE